MTGGGNLHSKFKQVLHLDTAGVWAGKHVDASRGSELPGWAPGKRNLMIWFLKLGAASAPPPTSSQPLGARGPADPAAAPADGNRHPLGDAPL